MNPPVLQVHRDGSSNSTISELQSSYDAMAQLGEGPSVSCLAITSLLIRVVLSDCFGLLLSSICTVAFLVLEQQEKAYLVLLTCVCQRAIAAIYLYTARFNIGQYVSNVFPSPPSSESLPTRLFSVCGDISLHCTVSCCIAIALIYVISTIYQAQSKTDAMLISLGLLAISFPQSLRSVLAMTLASRMLTFSGLGIWMKDASVVEDIAETNCVCLTSSGLEQRHVEYVYTDSLVNREQFSSKSSSGIMNVLSASSCLPKLASSLQLEDATHFDDLGNCVDSRVLDNGLEVSLVEVATGSLVVVGGDTNSVLNICSSKINLVGRAPQEALMNPRETIELTDLEKMAILREAKQLEENSMSISCVALRPDSAANSIEDLKAFKGFNFVGFIACRRSLRPSVRRLSSACSNYGIEVALLTEHSLDDCYEIAQQLLPEFDPTRAVSKSELSYIGAASSLPRNQIFLSKFTQSRLQLFYELDDEFKRAIIESFRTKRRRVAVIGQSTADATCLRAATTPVALKDSSPAALSVCRMVLQEDDHFALFRAIIESRTCFVNIQHYVRLHLSFCISALTMQCICALLGLPEIISTIQLLWLGLFVSIIGCCLAVENTDESANDVLKQPKPVVLPEQSSAAPPHNASAILSGVAFSSVASACIVAICGTLLIYVVGMYLSEESFTSTIQEANTISFTTFSFAIGFAALSCRSLNTSIFTPKIYGSRQLTNFFIALVFVTPVALLRISYFQFLRKTLAIYHISNTWIMACFAVASGVLAFEEFRKFICRDIVRGERIAHRRKKNRRAEMTV